MLIEQAIERVEARAVAGRAVQLGERGLDGPSHLAGLGEQPLEPSLKDALFAAQLAAVPLRWRVPLGQMPERSEQAL